MMRRYSTLNSILFLHQHIVQKSCFSVLLFFKFHSVSTSTAGGSKLASIYSNFKFHSVSTSTPLNDPSCATLQSLNSILFLHQRVIDVSVFDIDLTLNSILFLHQLFYPIEFTQKFFFKFHSVSTSTRSCKEQLITLYSFKFHSVSTST